MEKTQKMQQELFNQMSPTVLDDQALNSYLATLNTPVFKQQILGNTQLGDYLKSVVDAAERNLKTPMPQLTYQLYAQFEKTGERLAFEKVYFERRNHLVSLAIMGWLKEESYYIEALEDTLWQICDEYAWGLSAHLTVDGTYQSAYTIDLFAAETAVTLAEISRLLAHRLAPSIVTRIKEEVNARVLQPFIQSKTLYNWETMHNNWAAVCAGSIGIAACYLIPEQQVLWQILRRLMPCLDHYLESFESDGTCLEGLGYWTYGMSFYVALTQLLHTYTNGQLDLLADSRCQAISSFQQKCYFASGSTISFSDSSSHEHFRLGLTSYLTHYFKSVDCPPASCQMGYTEDGCYRWLPTFRDLIWTQAMDMPSNQTPSYHLEQAQWFIAQGKHQTAFAVKGGHNDEPHNHNDIGHFIYACGTEQLLIDLGAGEYTQTYFSPKRYTIFCNSSLGHSVPIINGQAQKAGKQYAAKDYQQINSSTVQMDLAACYDHPHVPRLLRKISFDRETGQCTLKDSYQLTQSLQLKERFVTGAIIALTSEGVHLQGKEAQCLIQCHQPAWQIQVSEVQHADHQGKLKTIYVLDWLYKAGVGETIVDFTISKVN